MNTTTLDTIDALEALPVKIQYVAEVPSKWDGSAQRAVAVESVDMGAARPSGRSYATTWHCLVDSCGCGLGRQEVVGQAKRRAAPCVENIAAPTAMFSISLALSDEVGVCIRGGQPTALLFQERSDHCIWMKSSRLETLYVV